MSDTNPRWTRHGLPEECPECGEEDALMAEKPDEDDDEVTVMCGRCLHTWTAEVAIQGGAADG